MRWVTARRALASRVRIARVSPALSSRTHTVVWGLVPRRPRAATVGAGTCLRRTSSVFFMILIAMCTFSPLSPLIVGTSATRTRPNVPMPARPRDGGGLRYPCRPAAKNQLGARNAAGGRSRRPVPGGAGGRCRESEASRWDRRGQAGAAPIVLCVIVKRSCVEAGLTLGSLKSWKRSCDGVFPHRPRAWPRARAATEVLAGVGARADETKEFSAATEP